MLVGRGRADVRVDDEDHRVGQVDRDLGLHGDGGVDAAGVGLPAAGVDDGEGAVDPLRPVRDAVAGHSRGVLDDGLAAPEDAVDQRRLAYVGAADDRHDREGREVADLVRVLSGELEEVEVLLVEVVVLKTTAQRLRA